MVIRPAMLSDFTAVDALLDTVFGPDRLARTAALLRSGAAQLHEPSLVAEADDGALIGSVQYWSIALVDAVRVPLTLLGPVAVAPSARSIGLGRKLVAASLTVADRMGLDPILLIGDVSYYGRFGFSADATGKWVLPGPVDRERLLLRQNRPCRLPSVGTIVASDSAEASKAAITTVDA